ncbi:MAG TPA: tetratricopeptide repeat protein [Chthoniobacterales bacterium]|nr:tetratricopeptide repeat protein [Chthoniobacterales bacterium]
MSAEPEQGPKSTIAHVLMMDMVAYSKLLITDQSAAMDELTRIVKQTPRFRRAESDGKLVRIPTGDGMALVFFDEPQAPVECAIEIATALKNHPKICLRMGIHSGPVNSLTDVNERPNVAGAGIDIAQRVLDCGDAGHILLSRRVADDLAPFPRWNAHLHDLGQCQVKHGRIVSLVNFYNGEVGNPARPKKCGYRFAGTSSSGVNRAAVIGGTILLIAVILAVVLFSRAKNLQSGPDVTAAGTGKHSIAVLPFENPTDDPNTEYLAEGIAEALINSLAELKQLRVVARGTAFHYKGRNVDPRRVGRDLAVTEVLTGKVRQVQDALSVQVDLVDASTGAQLWGDEYNRKMTDLIQVKQTIAQEVAQNLKLQLSSEEQQRLVKRDSANPEAFQAYLRGRYFWNKRTADGNAQAFQQFKHAIEHDPNFAPGYAGLADCYISLAFYNFAAPRETMPKAKESAVKAVTLDDSIAEAHTSLGNILVNYDWNWVEAEKEFKRGIELRPDYAQAHQWYAMHFLATTGRLDEAVIEMKKAVALEPASLVMNSFLGATLCEARRYDEAIDQCRRTIAMDQNFAVGHWHLGRAYEQKQMFEAAIEEFEKAVSLSGASPLMKAALGHAYAKSRKKRETDQVLGELLELSKHQYVSPYEIAAIYVALDDFERAFEFLEKAFFDHSFHLVRLNVSPQFEPLKSDARFQELVKKIGLPR